MAARAQVLFVLIAICGFASAANAESKNASAKALPSGHNLVGHGGPIRAIAANEKGRIVLTGSFDYAMNVWRIRSNGVPELVRRFDDHNGAINAVSFLGVGGAIAAGDDGAIVLWHLLSGKRLGQLKGHGAKILGLALTADQRHLATASWDRTVRLWDLEAMKEVAVLKGHKGPVNAVAFTADDTHVVSAGYNGNVNLWNGSTHGLVRQVYRHGWGINVLERLPSGKPGAGHFVFGATDGTVAVLDIEDGKIIHKLARHEEPVLALAHIAKPGLLAVGSGDGLIRVYRTGDWKLLEEHQNPYGPVWAMAFVDAGARIYYGSLDDHATAWQVTPREPFEPAETSEFPRRFQVSDEKVSLGERQFARKCSICHTVHADGRNRAGPTLYGIFGRRIASLPDYPYSGALKSLDIVWSEETIAKLFALGPHEYTPGSKMPLQRISDAKKRDALIRYLKAATAPKANSDPKGSTENTGGEKP